MSIKKYMGVIIDKNDDIEQKRFIPFSAFYPFFRVLSPFPRFIPFSAFYPFFRVLSLLPRFIPFSASAIPYFRNSGSVFYPNPHVYARKTLNPSTPHTYFKNTLTNRR